MKKIVLGSTGIVTPQNGFGALPIQRIGTQEAVDLLHRAFEGGMTFFDTARAYSDSEDKIGRAFEGMRQEVTITSKSQAKDAETLARELDVSLGLLRTDHIDIYQPHCVDRTYRPGDGTGIYEALEDFKAQGVIKHIGITTHKVGIAEEIIASGLYETLQYPLSYLSTPREIELTRKCADANMGFIAMKGLAGGLLTNTAACMAFMGQFDNVVPIWGIQRPEELEAWLALMDDTPTLDDEMRDFIQKDREALEGDFCRGCGYCMPCPQGIVINQCARISLMLRRAPSQAWLDEHWRAEMAKVETCLGCGLCRSRCPYELDIPALLRRNLEDYRKVLAGEAAV